MYIIQTGMVLSYVVVIFSVFTGVINTTTTFLQGLDKLTGL
jgi:hypothetical protein